MGRGADRRRSGPRSARARGRALRAMRAHARLAASRRRQPPACLGVCGLQCQCADGGEEGRGGGRGWQAPPLHIGGDDSMHQGGVNSGCAHAQRRWRGAPPHVARAPCEQRVQACRLDAPRRGGQTLEIARRARAEREREAASCAAYP